MLVSQLESHHAELQTTVELLQLLLLLQKLDVKFLVVFFQLLAGF